MLRTIFATLLLLASTPAFAQDWQELYTKDAVTVSSAEMEGTKLVAFKGDTVMDAPIRKVLYVLLDNDHRTEWVGRLYLNTVLQQNGPYDYVIYQAFGLPPIFSDRDYVYHGHVTDGADGVVTLQMQSTEFPGSPETIGVRAELVNSRYRLTPISATQTRVEVEILTDPKGMMPTWLVNMIQRTWPLDTLTGIRGQLSKDYTAMMPLPSDAEAGMLAEGAPQPAPFETAVGGADTAE